MPNYEYKCEKCGHEFHRHQKMSDPNPPCPNVAQTAEGEKEGCHGETQKLISQSSFQLKGGGWAADGY